MCSGVNFFIIHVTCKEPMDHVMVSSNDLPKHGSKNGLILYLSWVNSCNQDYR